MDPMLQSTSITRAAVRDDENACFLIVVDAVAHDFEDEHGAAYTLTLDNASELGFYEFSMTDVCYGPADEMIVVVGHYGEAVVFSDGQASEETINDTESPILGVAAAGSDIVACGTNLRVYKREAPDDWREFGPGPAMREMFRLNHLQAIAGYDTDEIYAAGRDGLVWWYDGSEWTPIQCATNLAFLSLVCAADGYVYLGGQMGLVAKGRRESFEIFVSEKPLNDIWGIQDYNGKIYCSMTRALLTWDEQDGLTPVLPALDLADTFYNLGVGQSILWSFGEKDVLRYDGTNWSRVDQVIVT